jgi:hypothetical protein
MQLPKYSAIELLYTDPGRASNALFVFNNKIYMMTGLVINDDEHDFDDIERVRPTDSIAPWAAEFIAEHGIWAASERLPEEALDALCDFTPPAGVFAPTMTNGRAAILRRARSYTPFFSRHSLRWYMPMARESRLTWADAMPDATQVAKLLHSTISGVPLPEATDEVKLTTLITYGYSCILSDGRTTVVGGSDSYRVYVYSDPSCRSRVLTTTRSPGKVMLAPPERFDADEDTCKAVLALIPSQFFPQTTKAGK